MVLENLEKYKEEFKRCILDLKHKDTWYKQIPNLLTLSRAVLSPFISIIFMMGHPIIGAISTVLLCSTDLFDGKLARKWGVVSKFGADLDAVCDKFMFLWLALPLMISNPMLITNFLLEGIISFVNVFGRIRGLDTRTVFAGKIKTCFLSATLIVGYLVQFFSVNPVLFTILASMTIGSQVITIDNYVKAYNDMKLKKKIDVNIDKICSEDKEQEEVIKEEKNIIDDLTYEKNLILDSSVNYKKIEPKVRKRYKGIGRR